LQSRTEGGKVFRILGWAETCKALQQKLTLWRGIDKVAEECVDIAVTLS